MTIARVFYSWQADLPSETNRDYLRRELLKAKEGIKTNLIIDEATRDEPGSPDISATILKKIDNADVFVADITTTTRHKRTDKGYPNPNVLFELGYAVAQLGWESIILVFNKSFGRLEHDPPFDLRNHRISSYKKSTKEGASSVAPDFTNWIRPILNHPPPEARGDVGKTSSEEAKHQRDVANLQLLLSTVHVPTLKKYLQDLPHRLDTDIEWYQERLRDLISGGVFRFHDTDLAENVRTLANAWRETISNPQSYHQSSQPEVLIFSNPDENDPVWKRIDAARQASDDALERILQITQSKYLEIDLLESSRAASDAYNVARRELD